MNVRVVINSSMIRTETIPCTRYLRYLPYLNGTGTVSLELIFVISVHPNNTEDHYKCTRYESSVRRIKSAGRFTFELKTTGTTLRCRNSTWLAGSRRREHRLISSVAPGNANRTKNVGGHDRRLPPPPPPPRAMWGRCCSRSNSAGVRLTASRLRESWLTRASTFMRATEMFQEGALRVLLAAAGVTDDVRGGGIFSLPLRSLLLLLLWRIKTWGSSSSWDTKKTVHIQRKWAWMGTGTKLWHCNVPVP